MLARALSTHAGEVMQRLRLEKIDFLESSVATEDLQIMHQVRDELDAIKGKRCRNHVARSTMLCQEEGYE